VYKLNNTSPKNTFTSNSSGSGGAAYFGNGAFDAAQGLDESQIANVGNGSATPGTTWQESAASYTVGGAWAFYRNGSTDNSGTSSVTFSQPINTVFSNFGGAEAVNATIAELDIYNTAITSTQYTALHNCAVSTYGVP
jgi:hypothetical protein